MMASVTFVNPIYWASKYSVGGSDNTPKYANQVSVKRCTEVMNLRGQLVRVIIGNSGTIESNARSAYIEEKHIFKFWWEPSSVLDTLYSIAATGAIFSITGLSVSFEMFNQFRFQTENPIAPTPTFGEKFFNHDAARSTDADLYDGEIHVLGIRRNIFVG